MPTPQYTLMQPAIGLEPVRLPLFSSAVAAGFPSPADDYVEGRLSLDEYLIQHRDSTFFVRAKGNSMTGAGIFDGDLLVVDKSLSPIWQHSNCCGGWRFNRKEICQTRGYCFPQTGKSKIQGN